MHTRLLRAAAAVILLLGAFLAPLGARGEGYLWTSTVTMKVPAVARTETGYVGVMSNLTVTVAWPGHGVVYVAADPLTELDTQAAARIAAIVGSLLAGYDYRGFDFFFRLEAGSPIVGGPSASAAMAVGVIAALRGMEVPGNFSMTGMVEPDAVVGPVGGVPEKLQAAAESGVKLFVVPAGQLVALSLNAGGYVNLTMLGRHLGVRVAEAYTVLDAYIYATGDHGLEPPPYSWSYPVWLKASLDKSIAAYREAAVSNISCARSIAAGLPAQLRMQLQRLADDAEAALNQSAALASEGRLYSAASRSFYAAIEATGACLAAKALSADDPVRNISLAVQPFLEAAERMAGHAATVARGALQAGDVTDARLQLGIAVLLRAEGAFDAVNETRRLLAELEASPSLDLLLNTAMEASYAYYRAATAEQWLDTMKAATGTPISMDRLREAVRQFIYLVRSESNYAKALGVSSSEGDEYIAKAEALLGSSPVDALTQAVKGYADYTVLVHRAFSTGEAGAEAAARALRLLSSLAALEGYEPILPMLYLEYSGTLSDLDSRLSLLSQGASYALLLAMAGAGEFKPPSVPTSTSCVNVTVTVTRTSTITSTLRETSTVTVTETSTTAKTVTIEHTKITTKTSTLQQLSTVTETKTVTGTAALAATAVVAFAAGAAAALLVTRRGG